MACVFNSAIATPKAACMMSSFAEGLLATAISRGTGRHGVTIRMVCDLIGAVDAGA